MLSTKSGNLHAPSEPWFFAGLVTSYQDLHTESPEAGTKKLKLSDLITCPNKATDQPDVAVAKIFEMPPVSAPFTQPDILTPEEAILSSTFASQILVFQYRGKFHAVDHQCPHRSYPLSKGAIYDIEDFGIVFSAGISCPKHGWAFDLFTGESDRGNYQLGIWEVQLRDGDIGKEVWVKGRN